MGLDPSAPQVVVPFESCEAAILGANAHVSNADCEAMPLYTKLIVETGNYAWEKIDATTEDGYQINMVHFVDSGDESGIGDKSPILLVHGV